MTRGFAARSLLGLMLTVVACAAQEAPTLEAARSMVLAGEYEDAERAYRALLGQDPLAAVRGLLETLLIVGDYEEAESAARGVPGAEFLLGEALLAQGKVDEAAVAYGQAAGPDGPDWLQAEVRLGELEIQRGQRNAALVRFDRFIDVYNSASDLSARDLVAVGDAVKYLGTTNADLFHDARRAYDEAAAADSLDPLPRLRLAELLLEKYQSGDAVAEIRKGLEFAPRDPRLMLANARALDFDAKPGASAIIDSVLEINPRSVPAMLLRARARLRAEDADGAREIATLALDVDASSVEARSLIATTYLMAGETAEFERRAAAVLASNPGHAGLFADAAEIAAQNRWYAQAAELARRGATVDSLHSRSIAVWGMNQLRIGDIDEGRANLDRAFGLDPFNVWTFNTLELLDTFERYRSVHTENFEVFLDNREAELLGPYMGAVAERALATLAERYGARPPLPIRLEVYPSHADFSVRTVGLAGLGALGVSFGSVLAMDSPSARDAGAFNWASTLWHEVAHSFHLAISEHRVPRWFTEGLAVWEQRRYQAGWGHSVSPSFLNAYADEQLRPVSQLNEGFVRPRFPGEVSLSYMLASLVVERIEETHGFEAILQFLEGFRDGHTTNELITRVLGLDPTEFDKDFDNWVQDRYRAALASTAGGPPQPDASPLDLTTSYDPNNFFAQLRFGIESLNSGDTTAAVRAFERAVELYPQYGGAESPYSYLGEIHNAQGRPDEAERSLSRLLSVGESHLAGARLLAQIRARSGDRVGAAEAWGRVIEIAPFQPEPHRARAELFGELGRWSESASERAALVALSPVDRAEALYEWALALHRAGNRDEARRRVLEALEIAPGYDEALELLLQVRSGG